MPLDSDQAVEELYRSEWGRIVATLIRLLGDFELAEEVAQEAFTAAVAAWRSGGVPNLPRAWIIQAARNKAIDHIRRSSKFERSLEAALDSGLNPATERRTTIPTKFRTIVFA